MTKPRGRWSRRSRTAGPPGRALCRRVSEDGGQAFSEYLTLSGVIAVIVIAGMTAFTAPAARTFAGLFRRLVLYFTSP